jgi:hypothetical protein
MRSRISSLATTVGHNSRLANLTPPSSLLPSVINSSTRKYSSIHQPFSRPFPGVKPITSRVEALRTYATTIPSINPEDIETTVLMPDSEEDFQIFKSIITNKDVVFTSSWMDQYFGINNLKEFCSDFELKLKLAKKGRSGVFVDQNELIDYNQGKSATQIALDSFFREEENDKQLRKVYAEMTKEAKSGFGYYKFTEKSTGKFLGGGALVPLEKDQYGLVKKVDIALHILDPKKGFGTACLKLLLEDSFEKHKIEQVWGSSIIEHPKTPTLCSGHGMVIKDIGNKKYYLITRTMWEVNKESRQIMETSRTSAADTLFTNKNREDKRGGR